MKFHDENGHSVTCGAEEDGPFECLSVDDGIQIGFRRAQHQQS